MIYKFRLEVCNNDNVLLCSRGEESGNFWLAFTEFMSYVMRYVVQNRLHK